MDQARRRIERERDRAQRKNSQKKIKDEIYQIAKPWITKIVGRIKRYSWIGDKEIERADRRIGRIKRIKRLKNFWTRKYFVGFARIIPK